MLVLSFIFLIIMYAVWAIIIGTIALMLLRLLMNYINVNPFTWPAMTVRRLSDPLINPVRRALMGFGVDPKYSPLITILLVILVGWFGLQLAATILNTAAGVWVAAHEKEFVALIGYIIYGLLAFYTLLIYMRIIFSWGMVSYANRVMRFLVNATDPLLVPLRRMIPPVAMFDLSALVALIVIWLFQAAVAGTLLRGLPLQFFK